MTTIRKNTKKFNEIVNTTKGWAVYSLSYNFKREAIENMSFEPYELKMGKLIESENCYTFRLHSNLWYTLGK